MVSAGTTDLIRSCGLDLDIFRTAALSLAHQTQFLIANVLVVGTDRVALSNN